MDILEEYSVGLWARRILWEYWYRLWMVDCTGGYCRAEFKGFQGVTQGYPLSPTIFNILVEAVMRQLMLLVSWGSGGRDSWGREVRHYANFFYSDDVLVALTDPVWLQVDFDTLIGL